MKENEVIERRQTPVQVLEAELATAIERRAVAAQEITVAMNAEVAHVRAQANLELSPFNAAVRQAEKSLQLVRALFESEGESADGEPPVDSGVTDDAVLPLSNGLAGSAEDALAATVPVVTVPPEQVPVE